MHSLYLPYARKDVRKSNPKSPLFIIKICFKNLQVPEKLNKNLALFICYFFQTEN